MADQKISARTAASSLTGAETVGVIQSATDKKTTAQEIADLAGNLPATAYASNTAAAAALGVGVIYKTTSLIGDQPILSVTV